MTSSGPGNGQDPAYWERYQNTEFYGSGPEYGGLGVYRTDGPVPPQPPPPPQQRGRRIAVVALSAVILIGLVSIVFLVSGSGGSGPSETSAAAASGTTGRTTRGTTSRTPAPTTTLPSKSVTPQVAGWQAVWTKRGLAYDVPREWKVLSPATIVGFEDANGPKVAMSGVSTFKEGYCTADPKRRTARRALVGIGGAKVSDAASTAGEGAKLWADGRYGEAEGVQPQVELGKATPMMVGAREASRVSAKVKVSAKHECDPPAGVVHVVAVKGATVETGAVFVIQADQDTPDSLSAADMEKMISSLRVVE
ncbi:MULTISPECIES: hypothetical protein [unclassified Crossiella]|uniref:hypothetical protein n=1 Tax=unclassified Crossiella TaxID=2620835 RepID=UPI001FFF9A31|nr:MULTISPECIES: hypothetical protein [unclassified Crossiella]MCK2242573.1 hypothetical protein [Crossiella sp. S99.2]MCK2254397.1 hypothetical protein [Crossiella sp. S99.1]